MILTWAQHRLKVLSSNIVLKRLKSTNRHKLATSMSVQQPPWSPPKRQAEEQVLRVYNSLTKTKVGPLHPYTIARDLNLL
jgi:cysteinyl-tRNA synthetase